jgi:hypothetical protein
MNAATILVLVLGATAQLAGEYTRNRQAAKARSQRLLELHTNDAASFSFFRDAERTQKLTFKREPVYRWTNPTRSVGQEGELLGREVWSAIRSEENTLNHDAKHLYRFYRDRIILELRDNGPIHSDTARVP